LTASATEIATIEQMGLQVIVQPLTETAGADRQLWNKQDTLRHDPALLSAVFAQLLT
jgi:hypothetical protein